MFAFKVLNLNKESQRLIFILSSVSLGLLSLLLSSGFDPCFTSFPFIHLPFYMLTLIMLFFYALSGDTFYKISNRKEKGKKLKVFSFFISYLSILIFPFLLFKSCLFVPCILLSCPAPILLIKAAKDTSFLGNFLLWWMSSLLIILYFFYISVFSIFFY